MIRYERILLSASFVPYETKDQEKRKREKKGDSRKNINSVSISSIVTRGTSLSEVQLHETVSH